MLIKISLIKPFFFTQSLIPVVDLVLSVDGNSQYFQKHKDMFAFPGISQLLDDVGAQNPSLWKTLI